MRKKFFSDGYIYIYSLILVTLDTFTLSKNRNDLFDFQVFSMRVVVLFSFWLVVKNISGFAERKGYSYKLAMILALLLLPLTAGLVSLLLLNLS